MVDLADEGDSTGAQAARQTLALTSKIVSAYLRNNQIPSRDLPTLVQTVFLALSEAAVPLMNGRSSVVGPSRQRPAVPIDQSITPEHIICLEDGKKMKMMQRHLKAVYGLTPAEYRAKWRLPDDYPMVAPNYSVRKSDWAKATGFGKRGRLAS